MAKLYACRVCGGVSKGASLDVKEMMFGSGAKFRYDGCADCGSFQISEIPDPETLARHYPPDYYSFSGGPSKLGGMIQTLRDRAAFGTGLIAGTVRGLHARTSAIEVLRDCGIGRNSAILDVGCGAGRLIDRLARAGFTRLTGIDAYLPCDLVTSSTGVKLQRRRIEDLGDACFDVIMFNHSFEHLPDPGKTLDATREKLTGQGLCIIRMPTPSSLAFETYGANWAQMDAPRHLTLISRAGMKALAEARGFRLASILDDSAAWSLRDSELYARGISMQDGRLKRHFTPAETLGI